MDKMIVYEDGVLLVVHKPVGIATETARVGQADLVSELKNYRKKKDEDTYIGIVHRLDQPVEGLLVFAKNAEAARKLSDGLLNHTFVKKYAALVAGVPQMPEGELTDYLLKDRQTNLSRVVPVAHGGIMAPSGAREEKGVKRAELRWKLLQHNDVIALLEIELCTGRHHQIRAQMAHAGFPLLGDFKYGTASSGELSRKVGINSTALLAYKLALTHPASGERLEFSIGFEKFTLLFGPPHK